MSGCLSCGRGFHDECKKCRRKKCHPVATKSGEKVLRGVGRPLKEPHEQKDPQSTGRKRAATLYPIFEDEPCEWKGQKNCGGGKYPIVGCRAGIQQARHHGPVKDTRHNEPGNVHRICTLCHNRWHALNNAEYSASENSKLPHNPTPATDDDILIAEAWWKLDKGRRLLKQVSSGKED